MTDQGTEFNNQMIYHLINATGVEHRITSAYHPRTNGQTERLNHVFVEALRKYTEQDNLSWPEWIPFVLLAFRTRIHSTTGFSPYDLMFGIKMNTFKDWRSLGISDTIDLCTRSSEIRHMIEDYHPKALENIKKSQEHQVKSQNKSHRISEEILPIGTKVYAKVMGLHHKLFPRYRGPFYIIAHTKNNNYKTC